MCKSKEVLPIKLAGFNILPSQLSIHHSHSVFCVLYIVLSIYNMLCIILNLMLKIKQNQKESP